MAKSGEDSVHSLPFAQTLFPFDDLDTAPYSRATYLLYHVPITHLLLNNVPIYCSRFALEAKVYRGGPCTSFTRCSNFSTINPLTLSHTDWIAAACRGEVNAYAR